MYINEAELYNHLKLTVFCESCHCIGGCGSDRVVYVLEQFDEIQNTTLDYRPQFSWRSALVKVN